jgi:Tfp pilus assembly protein PilN
VRAVNLLPRDEAARRSGSSRVPLLLAAGGAAAVTAAGVMLSMSAGSEAGALRGEVAALEEAIALVPKSPTPAVAPAALQLERTNRLAAFSAAVSSRIPFDRLLREMSLVLPGDAWLTGITATAPSTSPSPSPGATAAAAAPGTAVVERGVTIQGVTYSHESVARVLGRLAAMPTLSNVQLTGTARIEPESQTAKSGEATKPKQPVRGEPLVTFTILASVQSGGAS